MAQATRSLALLLAIATAASCGPTLEPPRASARDPAAVPTSRVTGPPSTPVPIETSSVRPFSARRAMRHVRALAARIGPRPAGTPAHRRAALYVWRRLRRYGYETVVDRYGLPQGGRAQNVIAASEGRTALVIGAHIDTVPRSPGGNDNASGVAVMLELARALEGTRLARRITFAGFGAEELQPNGSHHLGSEHFVDGLRAVARSRIRGMLSVDMIGKVAPIVVGRLDDRYLQLARAVVRAARRVNVPTVPRIVGDVSDHGPFALAGIPAVLLWTGIEPNYHSPRDVASNVERRALWRVSKVLLAYVRSALPS